MSVTPALGSSLSCGDTISVDTTLHGDLTNCAGDGLVIGADKITLNLNGHTIDGDGTPGTDPDRPDRGVRLEGHQGVTVQRGTVREFDAGIGLVAAHANRLSELSLLGNTGRGVSLEDGSDGNRIQRNAVAHNGRSGIGITSSAYNLVRDNTVSDNAPGVGGFAATHNRIEHNFLSGNADDGLFLTDGADDNLIDGNSISGSGAGVEIDTSNRDVVSHNDVFENIEGVVLGGDHHALVGNRIADSVPCDDNLSCGAGIAGIGGTGNLVARNRILRIRGVGIRINAFEQFGGPPTIGTVVRANLIRAVDLDGIGIATDPQDFGVVKDTLLRANLVIGSGQDGINVASRATTLTRNVALRNSALGIEAVAGVTDGGGNHAFGNGDPLQCVGVAC